MRALQADTHGPRGKVKGRPVAAFRLKRQNRGQMRCFTPNFGSFEQITGILAGKLGRFHIT
jgi:hypothetical protein